MHRRAILAGLASAVALPEAAPAAERKGGPVQAEIAVDMDTLRILASRRAGVPAHPASLVKLMTLHILFSAIQGGVLGLRDSLAFSRLAADRPSTKLGLRPGDTITVEDAILAVAVHSCNDAATAIAERLAGTEERFAGLMNARAKAMRLSGTRFANASGLPDPANVSTARDLVILGMAVMVLHPSFARCLGVPEWTFREITYRNTNRLLGAYPGLDVSKTGYTRASGFNLFASATRNGRRVAAVILGEPTTSSRDAGMAALLDSALGSAPAG